MGLTRFRNVLGRGRELTMRRLRSWGLVSAPGKAANDLSVEELIADGQVPHKVVELLEAEGDRTRLAQEAMLRAIAESDDVRRSLAQRTEKAKGLSVEELIEGGHVPAKVVELLESESDRAHLAQEAMLRAIAESDDVRRRLTAQQEQALKVANEELLKAMLPVLDNLELCLQHSDTENTARLREAIEMTLRQWYGVFERAGAVKIPAERGGEFDPSIHEGVMQDSDADLPSGTIVRILQTGFSFHGRVLRPTVVSLSTGEGLSESEGETEELKPGRVTESLGATQEMAAAAATAQRTEAPPEPADTKAGTEPPARRRRRAGSPRSSRKKQPKRSPGHKKR
jgi:molecular chaperone GrpE